MIATACATPITTASTHVTPSSALRTVPHRSLTHSTVPVTTSAIPTASEFSNSSPSSTSFSATYATTAGTDPTTSHGISRRRVVNRLRMSRQKNARIATSDPACTSTTNSTAGSPPTPSSSRASTRCPELDTGRNSVTPWSAPSPMACMIVTDGFLSSGDTRREAAKVYPRPCPSSTPVPQPAAWVEWMGGWVNGWMDGWMDGYSALDDRADDSSHEYPVSSDPLIQPSNHPLIRLLPPSTATRRSPRARCCPPPPTGCRRRCSTSARAAP